MKNLQTKTETTGTPNQPLARQKHSPDQMTERLWKESKGPGAHTGVYMPPAQAPNLASEGSQTCPNLTSQSLASHHPQPLPAGPALPETSGSTRSTDRGRPSWEGVGGGSRCHREGVAWVQGESPLFVGLKSQAGPCSYDTYLRATAHL